MADVADTIDQETTRRTYVAWLYTVSHRAVRLARRYTREGEGGRTRANECVIMINEYRARIRAIRGGEAIPGPGLANAREREADSARQRVAG